MNEEVAAKVYGLGEGEGEARWWLGGLATIKATSKETDGLYTLVEVLEPEGEAPLHVHHREDEAFWVLDGEVTFRIGDETIEASVGSFVFGPRDVPHTFTVHSGSARLLFLLSPGGFEEFIYAHERAGQGAHPASRARRSAKRGGDGATTSCSSPVRRRAARLGKDGKDMLGGGRTLPSSLRASFASKAERSPSDPFHRSAWKGNSPKFDMDSS